MFADKAACLYFILPPFECVHCFQRIKLFYIIPYLISTRINHISVFRKIRQELIADIAIVNLQE